MKVLIITEGYFPGNNYGGPPVSINNLCRLLKDKADFYIITKDHDFKDSETRPHTDGFQRNNAKCLDEKGISRFVPHSSF